MSIEISNQLIQSVKSGDRQAFGKLIDNCSKYVYGIAFKMVGNRHDAHDAAQESFIKVWVKINNYKSHVKFTTWLYKIVMNTCLDKLRKRNRVNQLFKSNDLNGFELINANDRKSQYEEKQFVEFIRLLSGRLSNKQHSVFVLHDMEEFSQEEISNILEISKGSVKSNLHHARKAIRQLLISAEKQKVVSNNEM